MCVTYLWVVHRARKPQIFSKKCIVLRAIAQLFISGAVKNHSEDV